MHTFQVYRPAEPAPFGYAFLDTHALDLCFWECGSPGSQRPSISRDEVQLVGRDVTCYSTASLSPTHPAAVSSDLGSSCYPNGVYSNTSPYPYTNPEGTGNIPPSELDVWAMLSTSGDVGNSAPTTAFEADTPSDPERLNWGSDMCFQPNTNYAVPEHGPSEKELMTRLLENNSWFILHCKDACGQEQKQPQQGRLQKHQQDQRQQAQQPQPQPHRRRTIPRDISAESHNQRRLKRPRVTPLERQAAHVRSERMRRDLMKQGFDELRLLVPRLSGRNFSKSQTLRTVCDYIEELSRGNGVLKAQLADLERMPYLSVPWDGDEGCL
ncbi:hypothetical protein BJX99DRAFT_256080 [Aspergillus californicus]